MMIRRLFVANRGEIALRILAGAQRLGIETVLGVSDADLDSVPARLADRCVRIGPAPAAHSYLDIGAVVAAASGAAADALHPGYGFLSESAALARACEAAGLIFVGPTAATLAALGDKLMARQHAVAAGVPVVPGAAVASLAECEHLVRTLGWPILIKAVGGGGGRGLRRVEAPAQLAGQLELASSEANAAFGDPRVYVERYVADGRHIEVQLLGDETDVVHLGTRDCSVQRRYQKLVEEAPAPGLTAALERRITDAAVALGRRLRYRGAGTVEFLIDGRRDEFYFLEVNARIQVEHPVTEMISGCDLVAEQLAIAAGSALRITQQRLSMRGHAIECRINAEDVEHGLRPSPGRVSRAVFPAGEGIRVDTHIEAGSAVPPFYDSLLAKIIVRAADRAAAIERMAAALALCDITGVAVNTSLLARILADAQFRDGAVDTGYLERLLAADDRASARSAAG
ncbi:MAG TPA: biotin carboxylase N-terminal domain-containing protein [Steroidobacteraceae bacterium]|jgi:acetyl-CoA carboxylase biotin carboxylase subunit|nr:biotin carboxylase N-terminal domain-containing protein [Steroidobacteraceae bacterium]